tara:strand:+ start:894 stop:1661 length:768 start_codon:yes stop_codon:yes gene_type:complete
LAKGNTTTPPEIGSLRALRNHLRKQLPTHPLFHQINTAQCLELAQVLPIDEEARFALWAQIIPSFVAAIGKRKLGEIVERLNAFVAPKDVTRSLFLLAFAHYYERDKEDTKVIRDYVRPARSKLVGDMDKALAAIRTLCSTMQDSPGSPYPDRLRLEAELLKIEKWLRYQRKGIRHLARGTAQGALSARGEATPRYQRRGCNPWSRCAIVELIKVLRENATNGHWFSTLGGILRRIDMKVTKSSVKRWERDHRQK